MALTVALYDNQQHRSQVIALWRAVFKYPDARNTPEIVIDKKLAVDDGLFFVALVQGSVAGTVMAGYDGHRGWIYSLAVSPDYRHKRLGSQLLTFVENKLADRGCLKVNLQILADNAAVEAFYHANGYDTEDRISMGKQISGNIPSAD